MVLWRETLCVIVRTKGDIVMLKANGFDGAVAGMATIWRDGIRVDVLVYDGNKMVESLKKDGMVYDDAIGYIEHNVEGAYVGRQTPIVMWPYLDEE
jgi:hypothetical protein